MRLELMAPPDVAHRRFADPQLVGQAAAAPLALPLGFGPQGSVDDLLDFLRPIASFASPPRGHLPETWQTLLGKASAPESHGRASALQLLCDGVIGLALGSWFRQLDLAPFDLLIWPHPAGESSSSMEPPSGLVGTVESVLCFPSRCGNPRCERISISGVSFHRPPFSFFFAPFFFLCACPQFSTEKYRARIA